MRKFYSTKTKKSLRECAFLTAIGLGILALAGALKEARAQESINDIDLKYDIIKIGIIESSSRKAYINNGGEIVGSYPHILYKNGLMTSLSLSGAYASVQGINDRGEILVMSPEYLNYKSFIYGAGEKIELDFLGYYINNMGPPFIHRTYLSIFNYGSVVGEHYFFSNTGESKHKWDLEEIVHAQDLEVFLINDKSQIAGKANIINTPVGQLDDCLVRFSLSFTRLPDPPFTQPQLGEVTELEKHPDYPNRYSYVFRGINDKGQIVGFFGHFSITNPKPYACMWDENGKLKLLDENPYNEAYAINDNGQIVGTARYCYGEPNTPFAVLYQNGKKINLNDFLPENSEFEKLESALDINNKGQIVGIGTTIEKETAIFLMNPIPKPSPDLNNDGIVNLYDLAEFASRWLTTEP